MMRRVLSAFLVVILLFMCILRVNIVAEDDTLDLNTNDLDNKQDNYSSLTDINGINIFTNDVEKSVKEQQKEIVKNNTKEMHSIFTKSFKIKKNTDVESDKNLFQKPVTFENTQVIANSNIAITPIIFGVTFITGCIAFVVTKKYYKKREITESENIINN